MAGRAQIVSTASGWNGTTGVSSFGNSGPANSGFPQFYNTPIFGQTFRAPTGADSLTSFAIKVSPRPDFNTPTASGVFKATVAVFNTSTRTIGAVLWTSTNTVLSAAAGYTAYNFIVNAGVSPAQDYVFFAEELSGAGSYMWGGSKADLYPDGTFVFSNTPGGGGTFPAFTSTVADAAFTAVFSVVRDDSRAGTVHLCAVWRSGLHVPGGLPPLSARKAGLGLSWLGFSWWNPRRP